jgi:glycosyltransferase involved in cell wall biosynthesis
MVSVCHISTVHSENDDRIFHKECVSLAREGYEVYYIVPTEKEREEFNVKIIPLKRAENRLFRLFALSCIAFYKALKINASVYHFHDPELMLVGVLLKCFGKKVIYDVHEDLPKQVLYKPWIKFHFVRKIFSFLIYYSEKMCCLFFDAIIAATPDIASKFDLKKTSVVRNLAIVKLIDSRATFYCDTDKFVLIYVGGLSEIRGIKEVVQALHFLNDPNIEFWLLGPWSSDSFRKECESLLGYEYVRYFGHFNLEEVYPYIKRADAGVALLYPTTNHLKSLPVKAFEYMACNKAMIMSDFDYWKKLFHQCAIFANPMDIHEIADSVKKLKLDSHLRQKMGEMGRALIDQEFSWEVESKILFERYRNVLN